VPGVVERGIEGGGGGGRLGVGWLGKKGLETQEPGLQRSAKSR
jgi:hypothetical protein